MYNEIPLSIIKKDDAYLLYFDVRHIDSFDKIESAYIKDRRDQYRDKCREVSASVNGHLSGEDLRRLHKYGQTTQEDGYDYSVLADVSEAVKMIASGYVENNGIVLKNASRLFDPRLTLCYYKDKIYPCHDYGFFEKKIRLFGYTGRLESPWFFSGISDTITFFVHNKGTDDITIYLENSPDAARISPDAQKKCVRPEQTVDIVPYKFSKFIRLVTGSEKSKINCDIWFQTQLRCRF